MRLPPTRVSIHGNGQGPRFCCQRQRTELIRLGAVDFHITSLWEGGSMWESLAPFFSESLRCLDFVHADYVQVVQRGLHALSTGLGLSTRS